MSALPGVCLPAFVEDVVTLVAIGDVTNYVGSPPALKMAKVTRNRQIFFSISIVQYISVVCNNDSE